MKDEMKVKTMNRNLLPATAALLLAAASVTIGCGHSDKKEAEAAKLPPVRASLAHAEAAEIPQRLELSGTVEADATYVGGEWSNKRVHIRRRGTKRGRGTSKQCVFGVVERGGAAVAWAVPGERREVVEPLVSRSVGRGSLVCTDDCGAYLYLPALGYRHESVNHHAGEYVRGHVHTQTLDGFWGGLKNFLAAKGGVRPANLMRFVGEHCWRYNNRGLSRKEQAQKIYSLIVRIGGK